MAEKRHATRAQAEEIAQKMLDEGLPESEIRAVFADVIIDGQEPAVKSKPQTWWDRHPRTAQVARGVLNTLPAVGAMAGGALAAPLAAAQAGTIAGIPTGLATEAAGVGLGAGAGRGARDLAAEAIGLEPKTTPTAKGVRIGADVALAGGTQAALPGIVEAARTPIKTLGQIEGVLPRMLRPHVGKLFEPAEGKVAPLLTRPSTAATVEAPGAPTITGMPKGVRIQPEPPKTSSIDPTKFDIPGRASEQGMRSAAGVERLPAIKGSPTIAARPEGGMSPEEFQQFQQEQRELLKSLPSSERTITKKVMDEELEKMIESMQVESGPGPRTPFESVMFDEVGKITPEMAGATGLIGIGGGYAAKKIYDMLKGRMTDANKRFNPFQIYSDKLKSQGLGQ